MQNRIDRIVSVPVRRTLSVYLTDSGSLPFRKGMNAQLAVSQDILTIPTGLIVGENHTTDR